MYVYMYIRYILYIRVHIYIYMWQYLVDYVVKETESTALPKSHTNFAAPCYVQVAVCVSCSFQFLLCAVFSLCYVQSFICVMCSSW